MYNKEKLLNLSGRMEKNLKECILPVWRDHSIDDVHGGFVGKINKDLSPDYTYPKAIVLMTRELWAFCNAYRLLGDKKYAELAKKEFEYIRDCFWDKDFGGTYFMLSPDNKPIEIQKRTYAQAFIIYTMAEYYIAFGDQEALDMAMFTYKKAESCLKNESGGYIDTTGRDWVYDPLGAIWWMNPGGAPLLFNSHLHMFESLISLYKATGSEEVAASLKSILVFLLDKAFDTELHHMKAGMDNDGTRLDDEICYGHDAEFSYLITDAAKLLGDVELIKRTAVVAEDLMSHLVDEGIDPVYGGVYFDYHYKSKVMNRCKIWWNQAETITALVNAYSLTEDEKYLDAAVGVWDYVENNLVDSEYGEWFAHGPYTYHEPSDLAHQEARAKRSGDEKASRVKCPYHSSRTCIEVVRRVAEMVK